jgi:hypothetical protein
VNTTEFELQLPTGVCISRKLTEQALLASLPGIEDSRRDMCTGWVWYQLPPVSDGTVVVGISLGFNLGRLEMIQLTDSDKTYGANWRQWSEEGERSRAESISRWLNAKGFPPGAYRWGAISAGFDPRGGFGSATVRFVP